MTLKIAKLKFYRLYVVVVKLLMNLVVSNVEKTFNKKSFRYQGEFYGKRNAIVQ